VNAQMGSIEVKTSPSYWTRVACGALLPVIVGLFLLVKGVSRGNATSIVGAALFAGLPVAVFARSRRRWARRMDGTGLTMAGGKHMPWSEFQCVREMHLPRSRVLNHYLLVFRVGEARVFPRVTANAVEVTAAIEALKRGQNPFTTPARG
jgi:hypothetical protein